VGGACTQEEARSWVGYLLNLEMLASATLALAAWALVLAVAPADVLAQFTVAPSTTVVVFADGGVPSNALAFADVKADWYKVLGVPPVVAPTLPAAPSNPSPNNYVVFGSAARAAAPAFFAALGSDPEVHGCTVSGAVLACAGGVGSDPRADVFAVYAFSQQVGRFPVAVQTRGSPHTPPPSGTPRMRAVNIYGGRRLGGGGAVRGRGPFVCRLGTT
jgi:hypothetical protein